MFHMTNRSSYIGQSTAIPRVIPLDMLPTFMARFWSVVHVNRCAKGKLLLLTINSMLSLGNSYT